MYYLIFKNKINNGPQSFFLENTTSLINKYNVCVTRNNTMFYLIIVNTIQLKTWVVIWFIYFFLNNKIVFYRISKKNWCWKTSSEITDRKAIHPKFESFSSGFLSTPRKSLAFLRTRIVINILNYYTVSILYTCRKCFDKKSSTSSNVN